MQKGESWATTNYRLQQKHSKEAYLHFPFEGRSMAFARRSSLRAYYLAYLLRSKNIWACETHWLPMVRSVVDSKVAATLTNLLEFVLLYAHSQDRETLEVWNVSLLLSGSGLCILRKKFQVWEQLQVCFWYCNSCLSNGNFCI